MLRVLILASVCAVISASIMPSLLLEYPRSLQRLFGTKRETSAEEKTEKRDICKTKECKLVAQLIKESMDESVDPCDDFYEYACGNWSNINHISENMTQRSVWSMVSKKVEEQIQEIIRSEPKPDDLFAVKLAKKWFHSCMDTEAIERRGVEPLLSTLWRHGGWPLIMEDAEWDDAVYNWQIVDDHFARLLGYNAFHDVVYHGLSYEDNATILIDTPHLPVGMHRLLPYEKYYNRDTSDENNESGEGSQEKGSKERGQEQQNDENEDGDEETEEKWDTAEENEDTDEEEKKKIAVGKKHKRLGHVGRKHGNIGKTRRRSKRDIVKQKLLHRALHQLKKSRKHRVHHSAKGKLTKHVHLSHNKLSRKKNDLETKKIGKHSTAKLNHNSKRKRVAENEVEEEEQRKKKIAERKVSKRLSHERNSRRKVKHVHERKLEKKLNKVGSKTKGHSTNHQNNHKIASHRVHHVNNKNSLKHKKISEDTSNGNEDTDSGIDNEGDDKNEEEDDSNDNNNDDDQSDEKGEGNNDDADEQEDEGKTENDDKSNVEDDEDDEDDDDNDDDNDEDNDKDNDDDDDDDEDMEAKRQELKKTYREHILNVSIVLSKGRGIEISRENLLQDIDDLIEFALKVGELMLEDDEPTPMTLDEFQRYYEELEPTSAKTKINWVRKVQKLFSEAGVEIDDDVDIAVINLAYIGKLRALLDETPSRVIVNYIHWLFISKMIIASTRELRQLSDQWIKLMPFENRESECVELVQMTRVAGYEYVKKYFSEDIAKSARDMIDDIQKEVEYQIKESPWMDDDTKHFVLDKLTHMKNWVGYPEWYQNATLVKRYFQGLTVGPSFYENVINYVRYSKWKHLREIVSDDDDTVPDNMLDPLELNAFFMPTENSISITAVDFQSPFFAHNRPWYVNFGIIGLIMGHEVNHGFDNEGHLYDRGGNQMEWLSAMAEAYNKRAKCFVDQYNKYSVIKGENYTIENYGNQTAGENIADTMGLEAVFRAYKRRERECTRPDPGLPGLEKFSNDQLFFLSFANLWCESEPDREYLIRMAKYDVHSTAHLRVIGPASNSQAFAEAFKCPVGTPMNPKRKCNIWK